MPFPFFLKQAALFGSVQVLALLVASQMARRPDIPQPVAAPMSAADILLIFAIATLILLAFTRLKPAGSALAIRILWFVALASGANILFDAFLPKDISILLAILLVFLYAKAATVELHNFTLVLAISGIGALLGSQIQPISAVFILLFLSVYDVIAVYKTGHMVEMAKRFIKSGVIPGIVVFIGQRKPEALWVNNIAPGEEAVILGTGDLVLPAVLAASAWTFTSPVSGIIVAFGALAGLFLMHLLFFSQKERRAMPALPPIAAGAVAGFLVSMLIV